MHRKAFFLQLALCAVALAGVDKSAGGFAAHIVDEVKRKALCLAVPRGISVRTVLVYEGDINPAIRRQGFFDHLVPFGDLLTAVRE